jgi:type IV pilus assembly protein PilA
MNNKIRHHSSAFTLVEIMVVVAIVGLLAAMAVPGFILARKQSQGRRIVNDCRQMDAAIDQWSLETGQYDDNTINTTTCATYLKTAWENTDLLNNSYVIGLVGSNQITVSTKTKSSLAGINVNWGPY